MGLFDGLLNVEEMATDKIQGTLEDVAEELGCKHTELFIMIKPTDEKFNFKCYVYKIGQPMQCVREITVKEILEE